MIVKIDMGYRIYVFRHILHMFSQSYTGILLEKKKKKKGGERIFEPRRCAALPRFSDFPDAVEWKILGFQA